MSVKFKSIMPRPFKRAAFDRFFTEVVEKVTADAKKEFESTVKDFSENTPVEFKVVIKKTADNITGEVSTDSQIYAFLNDGTSVRYATMDEDFIAKTQPGVIPSRSGRGKMRYVNRQVPRPGIEARKFDEQIERKLRHRWVRYVPGALLKAVRESGHGL